MKNELEGMRESSHRQFEAALSPIPSVEPRSRSILANHMEDQQRNLFIKDPNLSNDKLLAPSGTGAISTQEGREELLRGAEKRCYEDFTPPPPQENRESIGEETSPPRPGSPPSPLHHGEGTSRPRPGSVVPSSVMERRGRRGRSDVLSATEQERREACGGRGMCLACSASSRARAAAAALASASASNASRRSLAASASCI